MLRSKRITRVLMVILTVIFVALFATTALLAYERPILGGTDITMAPITSDLNVEGPLSEAAGIQAVPGSVSKARGSVFTRGKLSGFTGKASWLGLSPN